jgi:hypothetical protein
MDELCWRYKKLPRPAVRFYADAFAAEPELAADLRTFRRCYAAGAAGQAATGQGEDAMKLADEEQARLRQQALDWLRADLAAWSKVVGDGTPQTRRRMAMALQWWQTTKVLASLRDRAALDKLPAAERDA